MKKILIPVLFLAATSVLAQATNTPTDTPTAPTRQRLREENRVPQGTVSCDQTIYLPRYPPRIHGAMESR